MYKDSDLDLPVLNNGDERGICSIIALKVEDFVKLPDLKDISKIIPPEDGYTYPWSLANDDAIIYGGGTKFYKTFNQFLINASFNEKSKKTDQGDLWEYKITLPMGGEKYSTFAKTLQHWKRRKWVLIVKLVSGNMRIIGSKEVGAEMDEVEFDSATQLKNAARYGIEFAWACAPERAFYILP